MGRRAHKPDPAQRRQVDAMAAYGIPADDIGRVVGVDPPIKQEAQQPGDRPNYHLTPPAR